MATAVVHLYSTALYFGSEILAGLPNVDTSSILDTWIKFEGNRADLADIQFPVRLHADAELNRPLAWRRANTVSPTQLVAVMRERQWQMLTGLK